MIAFVVIRTNKRLYTCRGSGIVQKRESNIVLDLMIDFFSFVGARRITLSGGKIEGYVGISFIFTASWIQSSSE